MNTTIDAINASMAPLGAFAYADTPTFLPLEPTAKPHRLVLKPSGALHRANSREFQQELKNALEQVVDGVIIDLLWVDAIDADGIANLVAGIQHTTALGKCLSFESMKAGDRLALETAWAEYQAVSVGSWTHTFNSDFEAFLNDFTQGLGRNRVSSGKDAV